MQQITLTFEAHGENMSQDADQETAKTITAAGGADGAGLGSLVTTNPPFPSDTCQPLLQALTALLKLSQ